MNILGTAVVQTGLTHQAENVCNLGLESVCRLLASFTPSTTCLTGKFDHFGQWVNAIFPTKNTG